MSCTTEVVLEGLRSLIDDALVARYGSGRRCYRDAEYPEAMQAEQTPAVVIIERDQRVLEPGAIMEQDAVLGVRVMAGEFAVASAVGDDPTGYEGGPRLLPLLNEVVAMLDTLLLDANTVFRGVQTTYTFGPRAKYVGASEAFCEYPVTLTYARLAAGALGL